LAKLNKNAERTKGLSSKSAERRKKVSALGEVRLVEAAFFRGIDVRREGGQKKCILFLLGGVGKLRGYS